MVQFNDATKAFWRYVVGTRMGVQEINDDSRLRDLMELDGIDGDILWPGPADQSSRGVVSDLAFNSLEEALAATPVNGTLEVSSSWVRTVTWSITKSCTIRFVTGSITVTRPNTNAISINSSKVTIDKPRLIGTGSAVAGTAVGILAVGSVGSYLTGITVREPDITNWSKEGIHFEYVQDFKLSGGLIQSVAYAGVSLLSCSTGTVTGTKVKTVTMPAGFINAYGFAATRDSSQTLINAPHSSDIKFTDCTAEGVLTWEGFDTHAGINITFIGCTALGCSVGFAAVPCPDPSAVQTWAPKNVKFIGCTADSQRTDGGAGAGFSISGAGVTAGSPVDVCTGEMVGCTVVGHGDQSNSNSGGVLMLFTSGFKVNGVTAKECSPHGISLYHSNDRFQLSGVTAIDPWSTTFAAPCVVVGRATFNTGTLDGLVAIRGSKVATNVLVYGFRNFQNDASNEFYLGNTNLTAATTPVFDTGNKIISRNRASALGFYGVTPVPKASAIATPTSDTVGTKAAIDAIRVALQNVGIIA